MVWSVLTINLAPTKYFLNLASTCMIASISLSYMVYNNSGPHSFLLSKAIGCLFYTRMNPIPSSDASHSSINDYEKYGNAKTGHELMTFFNLSNVFCVASVHLNAPFLVRSVKCA
jgi:hypothetical protein